MLRRLARFVRRLFAAPDSEDGDEGDDDDGTVWNLIPGWQYGGRHAESGGLARAEQEQALQEIQAEAAEVERESESERR